MSDDIGRRIKDLRRRRGMTLTDLKDKTDLSTGFLSQLERGLTTIAIPALKKIAEALGVDIFYFFPSPKGKSQIITRSYERELFRPEENPAFIYFLLSGNLESRKMYPRIAELNPGDKKREDVSLYSHDGEELIYVLEGVLTLALSEGPQEMYPGDSAHFSSELPHNWINNTSRRVIILVVSTPNPFEKK